MRHRKIQKSRKHKKIKTIEPYYDGPNKKLLNKRLGTIDQPPKNIDVQEVPRKLKELMDMQEKVRNGTLKKELKKKKRKAKILNVPEDFFGERQSGMKVPLKELPVLKKLWKESDLAFVHRVGQTVQEVVEKTKLENELDVDITEKLDGQVEMKARDEDFEDKMMRMFNKEVNSERPKSDKKLRRKEKQKLKKDQKKLANVDEFAAMKDDVRFGEVVMQPPQLKFTFKKRKTTEN